MSLLYKIIAFDMDGTLTESKQSITKEIASLLNELSQKLKVAIISGGSFAQFEKQLLPFIIPSHNIILLPTEGSQRFEYNVDNKKWEMTGTAKFPNEMKERVKRVLNEIIASNEYDIPKNAKGEYIEDRETEIAFSALGQDAPLFEKEKWDNNLEKRRRIKAKIEEQIKDVTVAVAGTTSIDILPKGFDKARGLKLMAESMCIDTKYMVFVGDAIVPDGNDYSVKEAGIESIKVSGPKDTEKLVRNWVQELFEKKDSADDNKNKNSIVYFCAEYAMEDDPMMYAGGLGVLARDFLLEAGKRDIPFIAVGLKYGNIIPAGFDICENLIIDIPIGEEKVKAKVWCKNLSTNVRLMLLDTDTPFNSPENSKITSHIYDIDFYVRIKQQMVLGIGGIRLIKKLGIIPNVYHLNEGHTAFGAMAILLEDKENINKIVATKHTILSEAGLRIHKNDLEKLAGTYVKEFSTNINEIFEKGRYELEENVFSTTKFVISMSIRKNAVSVLHKEFEKKKHSDSNLISITNGVYREKWQAREIRERQKTFSHEDLFNVKRKLRLDLFTYIESVSGKKLNPDICTLVWARRFAAYKRPNMLFSDKDRLISLITNQERPLQCVISGKAHEADTVGKEILEKIISFSNSPKAMSRVVYIPDYSLSISEKITQGADIWLNTPELGKEACGTSGMKAALNGALQLSVRDGWVGEVSWEGR